MRSRREEVKDPYLLENSWGELRNEEVEEVGRLLKKLRELLTHALLKALSAIVGDAVPLLGLIGA